MFRVTALGLCLAAGLAASSGRPSSLPADTLPAELTADKVPLGLDPLPAAKGGPPTAAQIRLGRRLFFDPVLSGDKTVSCATCHRPDAGFAGGTDPRGIHGQSTRRRSPTLFNRAYGAAFFWDGRSATLEDQALKPIEDAGEMGAKLPDVVAKLTADPGYAKEFAAAFPDGATTANLGKALAAFQRTLLRGDAPVDQFRRNGKRSAMTEEQLFGLWVFDSKGRCWACHTGGNFTDEKFHNTGVGWGKTPLDLGRFEVTAADADRGRFKTPTLRGAPLTAPYMHDGSLKTLDEVVEFYDRGGTANPHLDEDMKPLKLTPEEKKALVAFLKSL